MDPLGDLMPQLFELRLGELRTTADLGITQLQSCSLRLLLLMTRPLMRHHKA